MAYEEQTQRDLVRADAWAGLDWLGRFEWLLNNTHDEFGFFYHLIDDWAVRYGHLDLGTTRKRLTIEDIFKRARSPRKQRGRDGKGNLQRLSGRGRDDQPSGTSSRATVRDASPAGRQGPSRTRA